MICDELQLVETCSKHLQYKLRGDGATPAGIACVLRLQAQAMPAESVDTPIRSIIVIRNSTFMSPHSLPRNTLLNQTQTKREGVMICDELQLV